MFHPIKKMRSNTQNIYLDYAATTPMAPESVAAMGLYLTEDGIFANPSSVQHHFGEQAEAVIETARRQMAASFNADAQDFIFTSGATESNNLALHGIAYRYRNQGKHIITAAGEHKSVLDTCKYLERTGSEVTYLRPASNGLLNLDALADAITDKTILVSVMHVNNETGVIQDIEKIAALTHEKNLIFHVDAAQSAAKIAIDLSRTPIDLLSLSAHKFYGPKGIGALYVRNRKNNPLTPLMHGGGQEYGLRPGTLPTHQIAGMAAAFRIAHERLMSDRQHAERLKQLLLEQLSQLDGVALNGAQECALPNIVNVSFEQVGSDALILALRDEVAIASGSACNSGAVEASHVLRAMGIEGDRLYGAVRISFGRYTAEQDILRAGYRLCEEVTRLRRLALALE